MNCIKPDVAGCIGEAGHEIHVNYRVAGTDGSAKVLKVELLGRGGDPPERRMSAEEVRCVEQAFARVRFVPFPREEFKVIFPFTT